MTAKNFIIAISEWIELLNVTMFYFGKNCDLCKYKTNDINDKK
jgi:hypothetical protein